MNNATAYIRSHFDLPANVEWRKQATLATEWPHQHRRERFSVQLRQWLMLPLVEELGAYSANVTADEVDWFWLANQLLQSVSQELVA